MLTRFNFGAARDPEMLHKIYNAEPVAPIIEIPRRDIRIYYEFVDHVDRINKSVPRGYCWSLVMSNSDPRDRFVYPFFKLMLDSCSCIFLGASASLE